MVMKLGMTSDTVYNDLTFQSILEDKFDFDFKNQNDEQVVINVNIEYGTVLSVKDGVVCAYGLNNVQVGELVEFVDSIIDVYYTN